MSKNALAFALAALLLGSCARVEGDFPSLSKRPYETDHPLDVPAQLTPPFAAALPAELKAQTDALLVRGQNAHAAFEAALPAARLAVQSASGAAAGSDTWVDAHMKLSKADAARADGVAALSEMDQLITRERNAGAHKGLIALLAEPQGKLAAIIDEDSAEIDRLAQLIGT